MIVKGLMHFLKYVADLVPRQMRGLRNVLSPDYAAIPNDTVWANGSAQSPRAQVARWVAEGAVARAPRRLRRC
ncbi:uncharacterized protein with HEPN domain [Arthrobacter sp. UYNi723]